MSSCYFVYPIMSKKTKKNMKHPDFLSLVTKGSGRSLKMWTLSIDVNNTVLHFLDLSHWL